MHEHLVACNNEDCTLPRFEGEVGTPSEGGEVSANEHALDVMLEMKREEEATERTEAITRAAEHIAEEQAKGTEVAIPPEATIEETNAEPEVLETEVKEPEVVSRPHHEEPKEEEPKEEKKEEKKEERKEEKKEEHREEHPRHRFRSHRR